MYYWSIIGIVLAGAWFLLRSKQTLTVLTGTVALRYRDGLFDRELSPGRHGWMDFRKATSIFVVPTTRMVLANQEITALTKDQFAFKVALTPIFEVSDPRTYHEAQPISAIGMPAHFGMGLPALYPTLQAATITAIATLSLDDFLADPSVIVAPISQRLDAALPGSKLVELLITAITMPPEIRKMFTEVERAKREGAAALERARGEQASLRALANAARLLQSNPHLAQLRLLQTMESSKGNKTFILGQSDSNALSAAPN